MGIQVHSRNPLLIGDPIAGGDIVVAQWSHKPIHVVGASAWNHEESARAITIRDKVLSVGGKPGQWRDDLPARGSEVDVPEPVAADPYAIGFTGLGQLVKGARTVALWDRSDASFYPTYEDIAREISLGASRLHRRRERIGKGDRSDPAGVHTFHPEPRRSADRSGTFIAASGVHKSPMLCACSMQTTNERL